MLGIPHLAGCSPPTPPVNGSVTGFTSSRVGAQVTYHCDTCRLGNIMSSIQLVTGHSFPQLHHSDWHTSAPLANSMLLLIRVSMPHSVLTSLPVVKGSRNESKL